RWSARATVGLPFLLSVRAGSRELRTPWRSAANLFLFDSTRGVWDDVGRGLDQTPGNRMGRCRDSEPVGIVGVLSNGSPYRRRDCSRVRAAARHRWSFFGGTRA